MEQLTVAGQRFGTPAYMSPEQALGKPIDERTDVYSTAVVLFEMLTGRRPFESPDDAAVLAMHAGKPPPTLAARSAGIDLPDALEELIARGLEKDPDDRYASAGEFIVAIDECVENLYPGPARIAAAAAEAGDQTATTVVARPGRWWTRRRIAIAAAVCVVAIGALALFGATRNDYAAKARQLLADGKPEEAIEYLESHGDDIGGDADAQLELGHAYAAVRRNDDAIGAYARAVNEQSSVGDDETLRTNVRLMLDDPRSDAAAAAATLLVTKLGDDAGRAKLIEVASRHRNAAHRARMRELAEKLGLGDDIDRVRSYTLDLAQGKTCDDRRSAVARLRALGDPAAIAGIEKAAKRKRNKCLRADADEAVQYLRSRK
jgi:tetratricopeptide (TPR) repeat protein